MQLSSFEVWNQGHMIVIWLKVLDSSLQEYDTGIFSLFHSNTTNRRHTFILLDNTVVTELAIITLAKNVKPEEILSFSHALKFSYINNEYMPVLVSVAAEFCNVDPESLLHCLFLPLNFYSLVWQRLIDVKSSLFIPIVIWNQS